MRKEEIRVEGGVELEEVVGGGHAGGVGRDVVNSLQTLLLLCLSGGFHISRQVI